MRGDHRTGNVLRQRVVQAVTVIAINAGDRGQVYVIGQLLVQLQRRQKLIAVEVARTPARSRIKRLKGRTRIKLRNLEISGAISLAPKLTGNIG